MNFKNFTNKTKYKNTNQLKYQVIKNNQVLRKKFKKFILNEDQH